MTWALNSNVGDSTRKLVLIGFANHAHKDGTAAYAGLPQIAEYANCSKRTVQRHVTALLAAGWMREGDQALVDHYPKHKRPVVYDLAMDDERRDEWANSEPTEGSRRAAAQANGQVRRRDNLSPQSEPTDELAARRRDRLSPHEEADRRDTGDQTDVTPVTERRDTTVSPKPSKNLPGEPSNNSHPLEVPHGGSAQERAEPASEDEPDQPVLRFDTARQLPDDFAVTPRMRQWFREHKIGEAGIDGIAETEQFIDHHRAKGDRMKDWEAAWRTWMRNAVRYAARRPGAAATAPQNFHRASSGPTMREKHAGAWD